MGVNQRLVRTSVFRLTREGWLIAEKVGRRSYYGLTGAGRRRFEKAFKRVYSGGQPAWDGAWTLVILNQLDADRRRGVRQELEWMGFGAFAPTVLAHPGVDRAELNASSRSWAPWTTSFCSRPIPWINSPPGPCAAWCARPGIWISLPRAMASF